MEKVLTETDRLLLRMLEEGDRDRFLAIVEESPVFQYLAKNPLFPQIKIAVCWDPVWHSGDCHVLLFLKDTEELVGKVSMQELKGQMPELGIDILSRHRGKGYGPEAIVAFCNWYAGKHGIREVKVRIRRENTHSIHIFEKLGAKYVKSTPCFSEEVIEQIRKACPEEADDIDWDSVREYILECPL